MRIAGLILGILGGLAAGLLSLLWLVDYYKGLELATDVLGPSGVSEFQAKFQPQLIAGYLLIGSLVLGIVGGILAVMGKGKIAGPLMLVGAVVPVLVDSRALAFTALLAIAGIVSLFAKRKRPVAVAVS
jgi:hypothetical protein